MRLRRTARVRHTETIVALIDVVFFLLVFFLLIGRMDATAPFSVVPPVASTATEMPGGGATVSVSATGSLALNGSALDSVELRAGLTKLLAAKPDLLLRINAHHNAALRYVLPLVAELEGMGARDVVLVVAPGDGTGPPSGGVP
jgi:biopolymer transport protein ExbD